MASKNYAVPYLAVGNQYGPMELEAVQRVLDGGATLSCGVERESFEGEFARYAGAKHAIATSSCTLAIDLCLRTLGLRPGDNVISTSQTYQSTVHSLVGAPLEVRFADIDRNTLCLTPETVEPLIDGSTRCIIVTHYGGLTADMEKIREVAKGNDVAIIEDCAHAHGALNSGVRPGTIGDFGCYSFQSLKNMSTLGQGGMVTTNSDRSADMLRRLRAVEPLANFIDSEEHTFGSGISPLEPNVFAHEKNSFRSECQDIFSPGTNSTLSEPAAAVGRVQLLRLPEFVERRRSVALELDRVIDMLPQFRKQLVPANQVHAHHLYTFFVNRHRSVDNQVICKALDAAGIEIHQRYFPLHLYPEWRVKGFGIGALPVCEELWFQEQVNLPIYPQMTPAVLERMCDIILSTATGIYRRSHY